MTQPTNSRQAGFTLVELAIVMIIIGLLIGGILKGQELITNARVTASVNQAKGVDAALSTFFDQYAGMPGDILTPTTRIPGCGAALCAKAGNGNGRIGGNAAEVDPTLAPTGGSEGAASFVQLAAAGILGGADASLGAYAAGAVPDFKMGGGKLALGYSNGTGANTRLGLTQGHYVTTVANPTSALNAVGLITPKNAANIDRKLDDGLPNVGSVRAGTAAACALGTAADPYLEAGNAASCNLAIRVQQ